MMAIGLMARVSQLEPIYDKLVFNCSFSKFSNYLTAYKSNLTKNTFIFYVSHMYGILINKKIKIYTFSQVAVFFCFFVKENSAVCIKNFLSIRELYKWILNCNKFEHVSQ